jgi:hypothetical protein
MRSTIWLANLTVGLTALVLMASCTSPDPVSRLPDTHDAAQALQIVDEPVEPTLVFINLLPWAKVDFTRGAFASLAACNAFVRALPNYSGYTTAERCEPLEDPVSCTVWQDDQGAHLDCFKGVGGCEIELKRHDLLVASGVRTIAERCEPSPLYEAWTRYQTAAYTS